MTMFSYLKIANMKNELLQEVYLLHIDESAIDDRESWDYRFRNQGIESTNILINLADVFFLIIILVLVNALTIGLSWTWKEPSEVSSITLLFQRQ